MPEKPSLSFFRRVIIGVYLSDLPGSFRSPTELEPAHYTIQAGTRPGIS